MATFRIVERSVAPGFFDIAYLSGDQTAAEVHLFDGLRDVLREIEEKGRASEVPSVLTRLRIIADEGLIADGHCSAHWLADFTLFDLEFHGRPRSELRSRRRIWIGRYYRVELLTPTDAPADMRFNILKDVSPPPEYLDFLDQYDELRASLLAIVDVEGGNQKGRYRFRRSARAHKDERLNRRLQGYILRLTYSAIAGIGSDAIKTASRQFKNLEMEVVRRESTRIKNRYVARLGITALFYACMFAAIYTVIRLLPFDEKEFSVIWRFREFFILAAGASIGSWLSFAIRHPSVTSIIDLAITESDQLSPRNRVIFTISLATVIGLILHSGMLTISINGFSSSFQFNGVRALLLGLFCGISEIALREVVGGRARDVVNRMEVRRS